MSDECVHPAEGGLEGREPIGGLFRDIKRYLHKVCDPLPLCWEPLNNQLSARKALNPPTSTWIRVGLRESGIGQKSDSRHELLSGTIRRCGWRGWWLSSVTLKRGKARYIHVPERRRDKVSLIHFRPTSQCDMGGHEPLLAGETKA